MDVRAFVLVLYIGRDGLLPMQSVIPSSLFFHDLRHRAARTQMVIELACECVKA